MIKVIMPNGFDFDQQVTSLIDVHSKGVDSSWLKKSAAVLTKELSEIRPDPDYTFVHVIALGDGEKYGANRNGDYLPKSTNSTRYETFVKHGNFYHNHRNKPDRGDKIYGKIKAAAYNAPMSRVELIVAVDNKKDPETVEKVARGEDVPVSMALREDYDLCSICDHKAKTEREHCFVPGTLVSMADGTLKPIETVAVGDYVLAADGVATEVIQTFMRSIDEEILEMVTTISGEPIGVTKSHPILSSPYENAVCPFKGNPAPEARKPNCIPGSHDLCRTCRKTKDAPPSFVESGKVRRGDLVYSPVVSSLCPCASGEGISEEFAWVLGLYMV